MSLLLALLVVVLLLLLLVVVELSAVLLESALCGTVGRRQCHGTSGIEPVVNVVDESAVHCVVSG